MTLRNDEKPEVELTCRFKIEMRNMTNIDPISLKNLKNPKSQKFSLYWTPFE